MEKDNLGPDQTDDATKAFLEVRDKLAGLTRAVDSMAGEWKALAIPDYTDSLAEIRKGMMGLVFDYREMSERPALAVTPDQLAKQINAASENARAAERQSLESAQATFVSLARELTGFVQSAQSADRQNKWLVAMLALGTAFGVTITVVGQYLL